MQLVVGSTAPLNTSRYFAKEQVTEVSNETNHAEQQVGATNWWVTTQHNWMEQPTSGGLPPVLDTFNSVLKYHQLFLNIDITAQFYF